MTIIMPFGMHEGKSIEEVAIYDYDYFARQIVDGFLKFGKIRRKDVAKRIAFVEYVVNNFVSASNCAAINCAGTAEFIGIATGKGEGRVSSINDIYCSTECYERSLSPDSGNIAPYMIQFRAALSSRKEDTNNLVKIVAQCMGLDKKDLKKRKFTKGYLEGFINDCELRRPYVAA